MAPEVDGEAAAEPQVSPDWISVYHPERAWNGYTLAFYAHRIPILLDMNGREVHRWPGARVKSRLRLLPDGSLLGIALGRGLVEYDWQGKETWAWASAIGFAHHDVIRLENGNTVTLIRPDEGRFDVVLEVDRSGEIVWQWNAAEHLRPFVPPTGWRKVDVTHLNSIQALPQNRWFAADDYRFRPGNYLMSSRELNLVFIVDRDSQEVVWTFSTDLDKQHEPLMMGPEHPRAGNILLFNNRYSSFYDDRQSAILEVDPSTGEIVWQFRTAGFYSPTSGVVQPLPNGNALITSSRGARSFEIDRGGHVVWEWAPPFDTTRSQRYPYDFTPQLDRLDPPQQVAVVRPAARYHVDTDVYRFARRGLRRTVRIEGTRREVLKFNNDCRRMVLPSQALVDVELGIDRGRLRQRARDRETAVRFSLTIRPLGDGDPVALLTETLDLESDRWRASTLDLGVWAHRPIRLCVETEWAADPAADTAGFAFWQQPLVRAAVPGGSRLTEAELALDELTPEELETRRKHLEALGYIN